MTDIEVHVDHRGKTVFAGTAHFTRHRARVTTTFTYTSTYLALPGALSLEPQLQLVSGAQYQPRMLGAFGDTAPDRWGRNLIAKKERELAREQHRTPRNLDEVDYLLEVSDSTRQGALRFRPPGTQQFVGAYTEVPRMVSLPALLRASESVTTSTPSLSAIKTLLDAGTGSLGGARPKASVQLEDGSLGLAKFPHAEDDWDVMTWEATALDLAAAAGIRTPTHRLVTVEGRNVLLLRRFDRIADGERIGYISGMTALGAVDGDDRDYADLAAALTEISGTLQQDRRELFDRAALNVAIGNTDDHLRNHGFLTTDGGWRLSPAFDINPNPEPGASRQTSIAGATLPDDEPEGLLALADACNLNAEDAKARLARVVEAVTGWRDAAQRNRITAREQDFMAESIEGRLDGLRRVIGKTVPKTPAGPRPGKSGAQARDPRGRFGSRG